MANPFPGMDPYLEAPAFWEGFHDVLITECMYQLEEALPPGYDRPIDPPLTEADVAWAATRIQVMQ